jgi:hypothetical protein
MPSPTTKRPMCTLQSTRLSCRRSIRLNNVARIAIATSTPTIVLNISLPALPLHQDSKRHTHLHLQQYQEIKRAGHHKRTQENYADTQPYGYVPEVTPTDSRYVASCSFSYASDSSNNVSRTI